MPECADENECVGQTGTLYVSKARSCAGDIRKHTESPCVYVVQGREVPCLISLIGGQAGGDVCREVEGSPEGRDKNTQLTVK